MGKKVYDILGDSAWDLIHGKYHTNTTNFLGFVMHQQKYMAANMGQNLPADTIIQYFMQAFSKTQDELIMVEEIKAGFDKAKKEGKVNEAIEGLMYNCAMVMHLKQPMKKADIKEQPNISGIDMLKGSVQSVANGLDDKTKAKFDDDDFGIYNTEPPKSSKPVFRKEDDDVLEPGKEMPVQPHLRKKDSGSEKLQDEKPDPLKETESRKKTLGLFNDLIQNPTRPIKNDDGTDPDPETTGFRI